MQTCMPQRERVHMGMHQNERKRTPLIHTDCWREEKGIRVKEEIHENERPSERCKERHGRERGRWVGVPSCA